MAARRNTSSTLRRLAMPIVHISLVSGRDAAVVKRCLKAVAQTVHETLGAPLESIRVFATPVAPAHWVVGDRAKDEPAPTKEVSQ
ncbi:MULTISPECIES: tautomerase family protein [Cupriavidus]|uniref:tautomerase family protein n=1 Tax=Cupriavidus sp. DF5525 TaxID=3160989 RepID=UPI0035A8A0CA